MHMSRLGMIFAVIGGGALSAFGASEKPFGTPEELKPCLEDHEFKDMHGHWSSKNKLSPECLAEVDRRAKACLEDPDVKAKISDPNTGAHANPERYCHETVMFGMRDQKDEYEAAQKNKQREDDAKSKLATQGPPKADMHNPQLEKAIADAYKKNFPDNKILKVILTDKNWDYERDAFGHITGRDLNASVINKHPDGSCEIHSEMWVQQGNGKSYKGPFDERGAGSLSKTPILCDRVR